MIELSIIGTGTERRPKPGTLGVLSVLFFLGVWTAMPFRGSAQTEVRMPDPEYPWETFVEEYLEYTERMAEEGDGVTRYDWLEELEEIHRQRLDLNAVGRDDLLRLHFLSEEVADSILARRDSLGGFRGISDLMTVRSLNFMDRAWLSVFVCFGPYSNPRKYAGDVPGIYQRADQGNRWVGGRHTVDAFTGVPLYQRAGYTDYDATNYATKMFLGCNVAHRLRYRYAWNQQVKYGITLEQDVGERMASFGARLWDAGSLYFYYRADARRNGNGRRHYVPYELIAGDFRLRQGDGLVVGDGGWSNFSTLFSGSRLDRTRMMPSTGSDGRRYLRGAAVRGRWGKEGEWNVLVFGSWRELDGTVKGADATNGFSAEISDTITAWKTDGLHRTLQEVGKRRVAQQIAGGGRLGYDAHHLSIGLNAAGFRYNKTYWPSYRAYNDYRMRGDKAAALSLDWGVQWSKCTFTGEVALDPVKNVVPKPVMNEEGQAVANYRKRCAMAVTGTFRWHPVWKFLLVANLRSFNCDYVTPYGLTLQAGTGLQNEQGLTLALRWRPARWMLLTGYADWSYHRFPTYQAKLPSHQMEAMWQAVASVQKGWTLTAAYKVISRQGNITGVSVDFLEWKAWHKVKAQATMTRDRWSLTFGGNAVAYITQAGMGQPHGRLSRGGALYLRSKVRPWKLLQLTGALAGFLTDDYYSRCYVYSPQLQGGIGTSAYYGQGLAATAMAEVQLWRGISAAARYGMTKHFDREELGSGVDAIHGNLKSDVSLEVRWRF